MNQLTPALQFLVLIYGIISTIVLLLVGFWAYRVAKEKGTYQAVQQNNEALKQQLDTLRIGQAENTEKIRKLEMRLEQTELENKHLREENRECNDRRIEVLEENRQLSHKVIYQQEKIHQLENEKAARFSLRPPGHEA